MDRKSSRQVKKAATSIAIEAFEKFRDELRGVADQFGLKVDARNAFIAEAMGQMLVRCERLQETYAVSVTPIDFGMYTGEGNRIVYEAVKHLQGTGREMDALSIMADLSNRKGTLEARDTAVRDEVMRFVGKARSRR